MGILRKKHRVPDETMETTFHEEETTTTKNRSRLGKWVCGSKASKEALAEDNKISPKNSSYSTSSSSHEDKREQQVLGRSKSSSSRQQMAMMMEMENSLIASLPPPAAEAAFQGRPRFDWIDVEFHAATRIQTIFRRHLVLKEMEQAGLTTSYIRNRKRQRKAHFFRVDGGSAPILGFGCCSMLAFGNDDYDASDNIAFQEFQRKRYEEKTRAQKEREEFLSQSYLEQKGIHSKAQTLHETKFRDEMLLGM